MQTVVTAVFYLFHLSVSEDKFLIEGEGRGGERFTRIDRFRREGFRTAHQLVDEDSTMVVLESDVKRKADALVLGHFRAFRNVPLYLVLCEPLLSGGVPVLVFFRVDVLVKVFPVLYAIVVARLARLHDGLHAADDGAADDGGPRVDGLQDHVWVVFGGEDVRVLVLEPHEEVF